MSARRQGGFSIIEILVAIGVLAILLMLGVPSFQIQMQNAQTRTGAEGVLAGMQVAKGEAIRRNVPVQMKLITPGTEWQVHLGSVTTGPPLQQRSGEEGSTNVVTAVIPADADTITFNGLGRVSANADGSPSITQINLSNSTLTNPADQRDLRIVVPPGGGVRLCDPKVASTDPRGC
jgi:type IV fimbrial biogenesis protein FimT